MLPSASVVEAARRSGSRLRARGHRRRSTPSITARRAPSREALVRTCQRLVGAAELEDADRDQQDDRHGDRRFEERRAPSHCGCVFMRSPSAETGFRRRSPDRRRTGWPATAIRSPRATPAGDVTRRPASCSVSASRPRRCRDDQREDAAGDRRVEKRAEDHVGPDHGSPTAAMSFTSPAPVAPITWPGSISSSPASRPSAACSRRHAAAAEREPEPGAGDARRSASSECGACARR